MFADTQLGEIHHTKTNFVENIQEEEEVDFWTFSWIFPQNTNHGGLNSWQH